MPSKSRRAASRQAQLQRRRRRGKARTQEFDPGPTESIRGPDAPMVESDEGLPADAEVVAPLNSTASRAPRPSSRGAASEPAPTYAYLGSELRRISAIATLIITILVALTFVLR